MSTETLPTPGELRVIAAPTDAHPDGTSVQVWCPDWLSDDAKDLRARKVPDDQWPHAWFELEWLRNRGRAKDFLRRWVTSLRRKADGAAREADQYQAALDTLADVEAEDSRPE